MQSGRWTIPPCDWSAVRRLAAELELDEITATVLVRRGYAEPAAARALLAAELPGHDPLLLGAMGDAVELLRAAIASGTRICVHGDYDVDGVCATALAVLTLRELGGDVTWHLPSRFDEGYGLAIDTIEGLAADGVGLLLSVDCGITAVAEVERAKELGVEVVVTDHHRPGERLPDCPVVATRPSTYPFPELAGTGVVYKLAEALLGSEHPSLAHNLDLVALATIADVVPLVDENRALASAGLRQLARTARPGLVALMRSARVDPAAIDATAVGFRLAPRINAAGRLGRPDLALALILTEDAAEADRLAGELDRLNRDRQAIEERIVREAVATVESWPHDRSARRGYVIWGEEWHEGVIGIVAARLAERFNRPVVLVARSSAQAGEGWKGSGRSVPGFDLHGALASCAGQLERFGGHRAAAGLSIATDDLPAFAEAFAAHADSVLGDAPLAPGTAVDAIVPTSALTLDLAVELARLAPFGLENPEPTLLVASVETVEAATVGEGKHLRFRVRQHGRDGGSAIAFGLGPDLTRLRHASRYDLAFRLKENRWNGTAAPQLVVRRLFDAPDGYEQLREELAAMWRAGEAAWTADARRVFVELELGKRGGRRQLLESATFRALLARDAERLPRAA